MKSTGIHKPNLLCQALKLKLTFETIISCFSLSKVTKVLMFLNGTLSQVYRNAKQYAPCLHHRTIFVPNPDNSLPTGFEFPRHFGNIVAFSQPIQDCFNFLVG